MLQTGGGKTGTDTRDKEILQNVRLFSQIGCLISTAGSQSQKDTQTHKHTHTHTHTHTHMDTADGDRIANLQLDVHRLTLSRTTQVV